MKKMEIEVILTNFFRSKNNCGGSIYISGLPGTGKTTCVNRVINQLNSKFNFLYVYTNGMNLANPFHIYSKILTKIKNDNKSTNKALNQLESIFSETKLISKYFFDYNNCLIITVDELDYLNTKSQSVLYNIFDWPNRFDKLKILIIGIANTMNLPELIPRKIQSRLGTERIIFNPYDHKKINEILFERIKNKDLFDKNALEYLSKKIANISGDIRQAFKLCSKAIEKQLLKTEIKKIKIKDIILCVSDIKNSFLSVYISNLQIYNKIILTSLILLKKENNKDFILLENIYIKFISITKKLEEEPITFIEFINLTINLSKSNLIRFEKKSKNNFNQLELKVEISEFFSDIAFVLESDKKLSMFFS